MGTPVFLLVLSCSGSILCCAVNLKLTLHQQKIIVTPKKASPYQHQDSELGVSPVWFLPQWTVWWPAYMLSDRSLLNQHHWNHVSPWPNIVNLHPERNPRNKFSTLTHISPVDLSILNLANGWVHWCLVYFFIFIIFLIQIPVSKQCRPWSDAVFCGVWSAAFCCIWTGSALFA